MEQVLCSVVAHLLHTVVHSGYLENNCKVTAGLYRDSEQRHLNAEDSHIVCIHAHSVVGLFGVPQLQLDHHVDLLVELNSADAKELTRVDDTDAAQLEEVADIVRRASHQGNVGRLLDLYRVVGDESVTARYKLDRGLALTYAALAEDKDALAVDLNENSVAGDTGSELKIQEVNQLRCENR